MSSQEQNPSQDDFPKIQLPIEPPDSKIFDSNDKTHPDVAENSSDSEYEVKEEDMDMESESEASHNSEQNMRGSQRVEESVKSESRRIVSDEEEDYESDDLYVDNKEDDSDDEPISTYMTRSKTFKTKKKHKSKKLTRKNLLKILPKKSKSAYAFYVKANYSTTKENSATKTFSEVNKILSKQWKELDVKEKEPFELNSKEDKERFTKEMEEFRKAHPEYVEQEKKKRKRQLEKNKNKQSEKKVKRTKKAELIPDPDTEKKELSYSEQILHKLSYYTNRTKKKDLITDEEQIEQTKQFIDTMRSACQNDIELNLKSLPAFNKAKLLPLVISNLGRTKFQQDYLDYGILSAIRDWLTLLPDGSVPNIEIRTKLINLLNSLPIDQDALSESEGLGKALITLRNLPTETMENKTNINKLVEKWARPLLELPSSERSISTNVSDEKAYEILSRRNIETKDAWYMDDKITGKSSVKHTRIPRPSVFDYAIRPEFSDIDENEGVGGDEAVETKDRKSVPSLQKKLKRINSRAISSQLNFTNQKSVLASHNASFRF